MDIFDKPSCVRARVCVCVCVCEREREREGEREGGRERLDVCLQTNHGPTQILYLKLHA